MSFEINIHNKITIVIVTFHSKYIIHKCLDNLDKNFKVILIENSNDNEFTEEIMQKYKNVFHLVQILSYIIYILFIYIYIYIFSSISKSILFFLY